MVLLSKSGYCIIINMITIYEDWAVSMDILVHVHTVSCCTVVKHFFLFVVVLFRWTMKNDLEYLDMKWIILNIYVYTYMILNNRWKVLRLYIYFTGYSYTCTYIKVINTFHYTFLYTLIGYNLYKFFIPRNISI